MSYNVDPDNNLKMIPKSSPIKHKVGRALTPAPYPARHERPNYILINAAGRYSFAYESGSMATYVSGSVLGDDAGGPIRLDIQPIAWVSDTGVTGDITFIYKGDSSQ